MDPFLAILLLVGIDLAARAGFKHAKQARAASGNRKVEAAEKASPEPLSASRRQMIRRNHDIGWWASEIGHGFPVHRTGFHAGWLAHKSAADHSRHVREEARTTHLETRAAFRPALADHRKRQAEALAQINEQVTDPAGGKEAVRQAASNVVPLVPRSPATRRVDGKPETDADRRFFDLRESGYQGPVNQDGRKPDLSDPRQAAEVRTLQALGPYVPSAQDQDHLAQCSDPFCERSLAVIEANEQQSAPPNPPAWEAAVAGKCSHGGHDWDGDTCSDMDDWPTGIPHRRKGDTQPTEGNDMATAPPAEMTYQQSIDMANGVIRDCDAELVRLRAQQLASKVEMLTASAVDPTSLGHLTDADEAIRRQIQAVQDTSDYMQAFRDSLIREHGQGAEYHSGAANGGATREFLRE